MNMKEINKEKDILLSLVTKREKCWKLDFWRAQPTLFPFIARTRRLVPPLVPLLWGLFPGANATYPSTPQESQNRFCRLLPPQPPGVLGCFHPFAFPMSLHGFLIWSSQALHSVNRWWRVCSFPPPHDQHLASTALWILSL